MEIEKLPALTQARILTELQYDPNQITYIKEMLAQKDPAAAIVKSQEKTALNIMRPGLYDSRGIQDRNVANDLTEFAGPPPGVHSHRATHGRGDARHPLQTRKAAITEIARQRHQIYTGTDLSRRPGQLDPVKRRLFQANDNAIHSVVTNQHVGAAAEDSHVGALVRCPNHERSELLGIARPVQVSRPTTHPKPGQLR